MRSQRVGHDWATELNWTDSFGYSRKELYCFARQSGPQWANALKTVNPDQERVVRRLKVFKKEGMISSWTFFWLVGGEVIGSEHHQPSGSNPSGVYGLAGSRQLTSSTWWVFEYLQTAKDIVLCIPWGETRTLPQDCTIVSWLLLPLISICLNLLGWNSGKVLEAE